MIWMSMLRGRGPSSSAKRIDWKRPSESSPPLMPTATLPVGEARVVVLVPGSVGHEPIHHGLEVLDEGALELVHEQRTGGVEGVDQNDSLLDVGAQHDVPDLLGDVQDLCPFLAQHREGLPDYLQGLHLVCLPD